MMIVKIWDLPTRVFHWSLVFAFVASIATAKLGGNWMDWHMRFGYATAGLLVFRLFWGVVGGRWSRFRHWPLSWRALIRYLRGEATLPELAGHTATGSWATLAMLGALLAQVATGLVADDEIATTGPLANWVSAAVSEWATWYHHEVGQPLLIGLVAMHLIAIVFYTAVKKQDLLIAMVRGYKALPTETPDSLDDIRSRSIGVFLLAVLVAGSLWVFS